MSRKIQGQGGSGFSPVQRPASGLFFFCSFLLLILLPASAYFEVCATSCLNGDPPAAAVLQYGSMSVQPYNSCPNQTRQPAVSRELQFTGKEIAGDPEATD